MGPLNKLSTHTHQHTKRPSVAHNNVSRIQSDRKLYFLIACSKLKTIKNYSQLLSVCYVMCSYFCLCYLFSLLFFFRQKKGHRENKLAWCHLRLQRNVKCHLRLLVTLGSFLYNLLIYKRLVRINLSAPISYI